MEKHNEAWRHPRQRKASAAGQNEAPYRPPGGGTAASPTGISPAGSALEGMARPLPEAPTGGQGQTFKDTHSEVSTPPTGCKRPAKVPTKPEGPESRTARYQIDDIRSYLINNITFYGAFLQSPTAAFPPTVPILLEGRAAFPPHAKRGGSRQPAHIPPSKQKTL